MTKKRKSDYNLISKLFLDWTKVTKLWVMMIALRMKYRFEDKKSQKRKIKGSAIVVCNHRSWIDIIQVLLAFFFRRLRFLIAKEAVSNKFLGFWLKVFGGIPIDRDTSDIDAIRKAKSALKNGEVLVIFPEGKINDNDALVRFKLGAVMLSVITDTPIIPLYSIPRHKWYQRKELMIGKPISFTTTKQIPSIKEMDGFTTELFNKMAELKEMASIKTKGYGNVPAEKRI